MLQLKARWWDAILFACPLKGDSWELWASEEIESLLGIKAGSSMLFLWSVSGQPCCVQMQPQQMTWLFHFQWWTAVDLWGHVVLVTIPFFAYVVLVKESVSGDKAFLDYCSKLSFLSLHFWWSFSREGHKPCWGKYYRRKSSPARVVLPLFPYSEAC